MSRLYFFSLLSAFATVCSPSVSAYAASGCESWSGGHKIATVTEEGSKIQLDDGTDWRVESRDIDIANNWLVNAVIEICDDSKLTNADEKETVHVKEMH